MVTWLALASTRGAEHGANTSRSHAVQGEEAREVNFQLRLFKVPEQLDIL